MAVTQIVICNEREKEMKQRIEIQVDKSITGLAGYDYGKQIYEEQVKEKINFKNEILIVFPDNIQRLASSFIQGFFEEFIKNIGISGVEKQIDIKAGNHSLKDKIINNLL